MSQTDPTNAPATPEEGMSDTAFLEFLSPLIGKEAAEKIIAAYVERDDLQRRLATRDRKIEAMKPVVDAAVKWHGGDAFSGDSLAADAAYRHLRELQSAVDAYLSLPAAEAPGESAPKQVLDAANQVRVCYCGWRDSTRRGAKMPEGADWWELEKSLNDLELAVNRHNELAEGA